jgi:hypothetical protein
LVFTRRIVQDRRHTTVRIITKRLCTLNCRRASL